MKCKSYTVVSIGTVAFVTRSGAPGVDNPTTLLSAVTSATPTSSWLHSDDSKTDKMDGENEMNNVDKEMNVRRLRLCGKVLLLLLR